MNLVLLFFLLQGIRFLSGSSLSNENRDLESGNSDNDHQLEFVSSSAVEEDDTQIVRITRYTPLTVPVSQFSGSKVVTMCIFFLGFYMKSIKNLPVKIITGITTSLILFLSLQTHLGVNITCEGPMSFGLRPMVFFDSSPGISYDRWRMAPLLWLTEILLFVPDEIFMFLQKITFIPSKSYYIVLFLILFAHHRGLLEKLFQIIDMILRYLRN